MPSNKFLNVFYVYMWLRADGSPYYVGKGTRNRAFMQHETVPRPPKNRIIIEPHTSESDALASERFLIEYYGRLDLGTGCLRNRTEGGDGSLGLKHTDATRVKMHKPHPTLRGRSQSLEHIEARAAAIRGRSPSSETRAAIAEKLSGRSLTAEHRLHISQGSPRLKNKNFLGKSHRATTLSLMSAVASDRHIEIVDGRRRWVRGKR